MKTVIIETTSKYIVEVDDDFDLDDPDWYEVLPPHNSPANDYEHIIYFVPNGTDDVWDGRDHKDAREAEIDNEHLRNMLEEERKKPNSSLVELFEGRIKNNERRIADASAARSQDSSTT